MGKSGAGFATVQLDFQRPEKFDLTTLPLEDFIKQLQLEIQDKVLPL